MSAIAVLHPGAMGAALAAALRAGGHEVRWVRAGRGAATRARAERAGLEPLAQLAELPASAHGVISVCPPAAALEQAREVARTGFGGLYVDANAVAPETAREIAAVVGAAGARFVDGGIIGPPPTRAGLTRLYLAGTEAAGVADWFAGGAVEAQAIPGDAGAASALKMCYAAYTKGSSALLIAIRALAAREGVDEALLAEWARSQPGLAERSAQSARAAAPKAWRFAGEMREIAATFAAADLPAGFHRAAAELYDRLEPLKDREDAELNELLRLLGTRYEPR